MKYKSTVTDEMFFHIRPKDIIDLLADNLYNGATVFWRKEKDGWHYSVAICSLSDNWCKRTGRNVSRRQYFLGRKSKTTQEAKPTFADCLAATPKEV